MLIALGILWVLWVFEVAVVWVVFKSTIQEDMGSICKYFGKPASEAWNKRI